MSPSDWSELKALKGHEWIQRSLHDKLYMLMPRYVYQHLEGLQARANGGTIISIQHSISIIVLSVHWQLIVDHC